MSIHSLSFSSVFLLTCLQHARCFVRPQSLLRHNLLHGSSTAAYTIIWSELDKELLNVPSVESNTMQSPFLLLADQSGPALIDIVRNIALALTAVIFLLAGLAYLTASVIVPAAAKELEKECLELAPELWKEYQAKLEPGQTMAQRPELMQELGAKLQPLLDAKIEAQFANAKEKGVDVSDDERAYNALNSLQTKFPTSSSKMPISSPFSTSPESPGKNDDNTIIVDVSTTAATQWNDDDSSDTDAKK